MIEGEKERGERKKREMGGGGRTGKIERGLVKEREIERERQRERERQTDRQGENSTEKMYAHRCEALQKNVSIKSDLGSSILLFPNFLL